MRNESDNERLSTYAVSARSEFNYRVYAFAQLTQTVICLLLRRDLQTEMVLLLQRRKTVQLRGSEAIIELRPFRCAAHAVVTKTMSAPSTLQ